MTTRPPVTTCGGRWKPTGGSTSAPRSPTPPRPCKPRCANSRDDTLLGVLHVTQSWRPDLAAEAAAVLGTADPAHAGARYLLQQVHPRYVTGELDVVRPL